MKAVRIAALGIIALFAAAAFTVACHQFNNPVDPGAASYQGFLTVGTIAEVVPVSPVNGASIIFFSFTCSLCPSADLYAVQIADSSGGFAAPIYDRRDFTGNRMALTDANLSPGTFQWRVSAHGKGGDWGQWSAPLTVVLQTADFGTISPSDGGKTVDTTPLLDWGDVTNAAGYQVQVADTETGLSAAPPIPTTISQYQLPEALAIGDTRYWRVRPVNADGVQGSWSAGWSFSVSTPLLEMISVTGGTFQMGSTSGYSDEQPVHSVTVSGFQISKYEVTQAQYQQVVGSNPAHFKDGTDAPSRPVEQVSWYDAVAFCNALSDLAGLARVYTISGTNITADFSKNGYRLPTEAEWEFAARGGNQSNGYTYSGSNTVGGVAWYGSNSGGTTHPVGTKAPNELGLYDMSGNVWEWCWDWYGSYSSTAQTDPTGPSSGSYRVLRGGSWHYDDNYARSASRNYFDPGGRYYYGGFRAARRQD